MSKKIEELRNMSIPAAQGIVDEKYKKGKYKVLYVRGQMNSSLVSSLHVELRTLHQIDTPLVDVKVSKHLIAVCKIRKQK